METPRFEKELLTFPAGRSSVAPNGALVLGVAALLMLPLGIREGILGIFPLLVALALYRYQATRPPTKRRIAASRAGVTVDGELTVPRERIAAGFFQPTPSGWTTVRLIDAKGASLFEAVADGPTSDELLRAVGLDVGSHTMAMKGASPLMAAGRPAGAILAVLWAALGAAFAGLSYPIALLMPLLAVLVAVAAVPSSFRVGVDGVFTQWLWRRRFVRAADIAAVRTTGEAGFVLELHDGKRIVLASGHAKSTRAREERDAVVARIQEMLRVHRSRQEPAMLHELLARAGRSRADWTRDLRMLRDGGSGYRGAGVRADDLLHVLEDPGAPEDARAGAAFLLRDDPSELGGGDDDVRARVRVAADATASPRLRVALLAASEREATDPLASYDADELTEESNARRV